MAFALSSHSAAGDDGDDLDLRHLGRVQSVWSPYMTIIIPPKISLKTPWRIDRVEPLSSVGSGPSPRPFPATRGLPCLPDRLVAFGPPAGRPCRSCAAAVDPFPATAFTAADVVCSDANATGRLGSGPTRLGRAQAAGLAGITLLWKKNSGQPKHGSCSSLAFEVAQAEIWVRLGQQLWLVPPPPMRWPNVGGGGIRAGPTIKLSVAWLTHPACPKPQEHPRECSINGSVTQQQNQNKPALLL